MEKDTVSDAELVNRLHEILQTSDLNTTTPGSVRRQLELDFGVDLSQRKRFISQQIDEFLAQQQQNGEEEGDVNEEQAEERDGNGEQAEEDDNDDEDKERSDEDEDKGKKKRGGGGFAKVCSLSPQLQDFFGVPELARTEVVKKLWAYIRENSLQNPQNKRNINCDDKLHAIFRVDSIDMFQMNKALSKHIWPLDSPHEPSSAKPSSKEKQKPKRKKEGEDEEKQKAKRQKGGTSGFLAPLQLSEALVKFIGTGETALSRSDVVKRMWEYIKQHNLQDPSDKRRIICDDKLKELFDVETFLGFSVTKLLTVHFIKNEQ